MLASCKILPGNTVPGCKRLIHTSLEAADISFSALQLSLIELFAERTADALLDELAPFREEPEREFRGESLELETLPA